MATRCIPMGVIIAEGSDMMIDPPPATSHVHQPDWLQRRHPSEGCAPRHLVSSLLQEQAHEMAPSPTACITSYCMGSQDLLLFSAAGPARELISLTQVPAVPTAYATASALPQFRPHYARAAGPLLQLVINSRAVPGWDRVLWHENLPILAARSRCAVQFLQLARSGDGPNPATAAGSVEASTSADGTGADSRWTLNSLGSVSLGENNTLRGGRRSTVFHSGPASDFAWCRRLPQRGALLQEDGSILDIALDPGTPSPIVTPAWIPDSSFLSSSLENLSSLDSLGVLRCTFLPDHPRRVAVALKTQLGTVDLRGSASPASTFQKVYTCAPGQWLTALAAPPHSEGEEEGEGAFTENAHLLAAATATRVLLFDLRRPQKELASWTHGMDPGSKVDTLAELRTAGPSELLWLPPLHSSFSPQGDPISGGSSSSTAALDPGRSPPLYRILASNAWTGRGIVCEWSSVRSHGCLAAKKGRVWEFSRGSGGESTAAAAAAAAGVASSEAEFSWEPSCWSTIHPRQPPLLLFDAQYPPSLVAARDHGRAVQRHRRESQKSKGETGDTVVNVLPSAWQGPSSLGISVVTEVWETGRALQVPIVSMVSPTQEIVVSRLQQEGLALPAHAPVASAGDQLAVLFPQAEMGDEQADVLQLRNEIASQVYKIKQPVTVRLPLHRWLLDEAIQQYNDLSFTEGASAGTPLLENNDDASTSHLTETLARIRVPATAFEIYTAYEKSLHSSGIDIDIDSNIDNGTISKEIAPIPPTVVPGKVKKKVSRGRRTVAETTNNNAAFESELRRAGIVPLPPGVYNSPTDPECPDLGAQAAATGWKGGSLFPIVDFERKLENSVGLERGQKGYFPSNNPPQADVHVFTCKLKYSSSGVRGEEESAPGLEVPMRNMHSGSKAVGAGLVVVPAKAAGSESRGNTVPVPRVIMRGPSKPPSSEGKEALAKLAEKWEVAGASSGGEESV